MKKFLDYFVPTRYNLSFLINRKKDTLTGCTVIYGQALTSEIMLHAKDLDIQSVKINNTEVDFQYDQDTIILKNFSIRTELEITLNYTAKITPNMEGVYLSTYQYRNQTQKIVATQFESHYARQCFPCIDEPAAKATFELTITSEDPKDIIVSNMPVKEKQGNTTIFQTTPKMSTYLLAFAIGQFQSYETVSKSSVKITTYAGLHQDPKLLKYPGNFAAKCVDFYNELFKVPFPLPKLDQLALPDFEAGAMENWGLMTFRERCLLTDDKAAVDARAYVSTVIAHEISHMWFGDLVTMQWWDDLWLNESFACLMETYAVDKIDPSLEVWDDFYTTTVMPALNRDCLPGVQSVKVEVRNVEDIANLFDGAIVYAKGARLMLMLMRLMGEENFFKGISAYFENHKYSNTVADDLWRELTQFANFDVKGFMTPWLTQSGYPVLDGQNQQRFLIAGKPDIDTKYPVPEVKDDLSGHYLIKLSDQEFSNKLKAFDQLNKEQKLRILIDRRLLAKANQVSSASLVDLIKAFNDEPDPLIWDLLTTIIADIRRFVVPDSQDEKNLKRIVRKMIDKPYQRIGFDIPENESYQDIRLRSTIYALLNFTDDPDFYKLIFSNYNINKVIAASSEDSPQGNDPRNRSHSPVTTGRVDSASEEGAVITSSVLDNLMKLNPNYRHIILMTLSKHDDSLMSKLFDVYQIAADPDLKSDLMAAICETRSKKNLRKLLSYCKDETKIRTQDRLMFFLRILRNPKGKDLALAWFYKNWDFLYKSEGDKSIADYPRYIANILNEKEDINQFINFFAPKKDAKILSRTLKIAFAELPAQLKLIEANTEAVKVKLAEQ